MSATIARPASQVLRGLAVGLALMLGACQRTGPTPVTADDMSMGDPKAKVEIVEYASVACPHCARFNNETFPAFKAKYVDTGKVHYVAREFLVGGGDEVSLAVAGFLTARCAGRDKYFLVTDAVYHAQGEINRTGQPHGILLNIARSVGLTDAKFEACIADEKAISALQKRVEGYAKNDKINSTPTFIVNGKKYEAGEMSLEQMDAAVAEAQARGKPAT